LGGTDFEGEGKQVLVGICAMAKKSQSKPMKEILTRLEEFEYIKILVIAEDVILKVSDPRHLHQVSIKITVLNTIASSCLSFLFAH
jgi:hypothetical protein